MGVRWCWRRGCLSRWCRNGRWCSCRCCRHVFLRVLLAAAVWMPWVVVVVLWVVVVVVLWVVVVVVVGSCQ